MFTIVIVIVWLKQPTIMTIKNRQQLSALIKQFRIESSEVYGYRNIYYDSKNICENCEINRIHQLIKADGSQYTIHK